MWRRGRVEVTAPADGIVSRRMARVGGYAAGAAEPMFRIVAKGEVELDAEVTETRHAASRTGRRRASRSPVSARSTGTVRLVSPEVDKSTRLGRVRIFLGDNPGLRVGSFARGQIVDRQRQRPRGAGVRRPLRSRRADRAGGARQPRRDAEIETGLAAGAIVQVRDGLAEGDLVVTRSGTFLREGDAVRPVRGRRHQAERGALMNWNISAWSIRRPVPSLVLFLVLMVLGWVSFDQLPVTRFPNIDVPIVQVHVYQAGAAPSELEVQVTKKIEDAVAGVNGVKHQTSSITEGSSLTTIEFRLEIQQDRAAQRREGRHRAHPLGAAAHHRRADRHAHRGRRAADRHVRGARAGHDARAALVVRGRYGRARAAGREGRVAGRAHRRRRPRDPHRARSRPAAGLRHHRGRREPAAARHARGPGRRARRDRRARAGDPHARRQAVRWRTSPPPPSRCRAGRKVRLDQLGTVTDATAEPRTFAALDGVPVVAFAISRAKGASDTVVAADVAKKIAELQKAHPEVELKHDRHDGDLHAGRLSLDHDDADRGRRPRHHRGVHVPARFARDRHRGRRAAAVDRSRVLGARCGGLLAQPRQPARHHHRHRHPGRRRDRRDREHRAAHAHGQERLSRGAGGRRRDRPRGDRHHADHRRRVRAGELHGRHRRAVLQAVRPGGRVRGVLLAAGGAADHAAARRLLHAQQGP